MLFSSLLVVIFSSTITSEMLFGPQFGAHSGLASDFEDSASCLLHRNPFALTCKHHILELFIVRDI